MNRSYEINSKEDIDKYIDELRNKLLKELEEQRDLQENPLLKEADQRASFRSDYPLWNRKYLRG